MIPYNPSSFNSNKTILEQILELKRWLMEHPSYKIYYIFDLWNTLTPQYTWNFSDVVGDATNIAEGDVVSFSNPYVASVISVDSANETFTIAPATSYAGPQGPTGPQGVSITNVQIDANNDLIVTLSNGNTINAGNIGSGSGAYIIKITTTSGTLSAEDLAVVNDRDAFCIIEYKDTFNKYHYFYKEELLGNYWRFTAVAINGGFTEFCYYDVHYSTGVYYSDNVQQIIQVENIDPVTATSGQVPTSDGNGHVYWQSIPAPEGTAVKSTGATSGQVLTANGSNGASWQAPATPSVEGTSVLSTGATSGQVLQADGNGGASWQNAGGGGSVEGVDVLSTGISARYFLEATGSGTSQWTLLNSLYQHNISLYNDSIRFTISLQIMNNDNSSLNTIDKIKGAILYSHNTQDKRAIASGSYYDVNTSTLYNVCGMFRLNTNKLMAVVIDPTGNRSNIEITSATISDYVKSLE